MIERPPREKGGAGPAPSRGGIIALIVVAGMLSGVAAASPVAAAVVLRDGAWAAFIVLGATGLGLNILRVLRLHEGPIRWHLLGGAGLGLGLLSLLVLGLGLLGILHRGVWVGLLTVLIAMGVMEVWRGWKVRGAILAPGTLAPANAGDDAWIKWLWLGVIGFGVLALLAGTMPPGTLWPQEGYGYDVLEYHLGVPREYLEAGRIAYLPHNIYSNFPFSVEMLYLLAMVLRGDAVGAALTANLLNVMLGMLTVAAVWLAGREYGRGGGIVAGLIAASCPFLVYLSGVAYVENGMLLFAALSVAAVLRAGRLASDGMSKWLILAGLFSGLACGCKYTAIPAVLVPLTLAIARFAMTRRPRRPALPFVFVLAAVATFGPWLAKNSVMTGNPVFPLARSIFGERAGVWDDDDAARWYEGHLPAPADRVWSQRLARLWQEVLGSKLFGPALVLAVVAGAVGGLARLRRKEAAAPSHPRAHEDKPEGFRQKGGEEGASAGPALDPCWWMLIVGMAVWVEWTHLVGRFAIALIVPAAVMLGRSWQVLVQGRRRAGTWAGAGVIGIGVLLGVVGLNAYTSYAMFTREPMSLLKLGVFGRTDVITDGYWPGQQHVPKLNALLAKGEKILVVADARRFYLDHGADYCVVFNRNPFAEAAAHLAPNELMDWLRARGYGWIYVDWAEMRRLRGSRYGFWASVDKDLFDRLTAVGLRPAEDMEVPGRQVKYATLFEVPQSRQNPASLPQ